MMNEDFSGRFLLLMRKRRRNFSNVEPWEEAIKRRG